tara:strand:+ start:2077 stop:3165 length:1089 start_codon:yes stop_codon:yes gene_type:complete
MLSTQIFEQIDEKIVELETRYRGHFGMSGVGDDDERKLWLSFRHCLNSSFEGRMLRLFNLGNRIEDQVVDDIKRTKVMSVAAEDQDGNQFSASLLGGHFAGSCDGLLKGVFPEPNEETIVLLEVKSANDKRFKQLQKEGDYGAWSETYRWQIHCYMGAFSLTHALVVVVNKNTSEIYTEIIEFEPEIWEQAQEKAKRIICSEAPPPPSRSESDWRMKNESSAYQDVYFKRRLPQSVNCRNCINSNPVVESHGAVWYCSRKKKALTFEEQRAGCDEHLWIPALVNADHLPDESTEDKMVYRVGIMKIFNVVSSKRGEYKYSSCEMRELSKTGFDLEMIDTMEPIKNEFDGTYVETMDESIVPF